MSMLRLTCLYWQSLCCLFSETATLDKLSLAILYNAICHVIHLPSRRDLKMEFGSQ